MADRSGVGQNRRADRLIWLSVGFGMMYLLAALQAIDIALYEAADMDGANSWARFWQITLPGIKPVLVF